MLYLFVCMLRNTELKTRKICQFFTKHNVRLCLHPAIAYCKALPAIMLSNKPLLTYALAKKIAHKL
jgi:hypothetical protein